MMNHSKPRIDGLQLRQDERSVISAAIVDHDYFVVIGQLSKRPLRQNDQAANRAGIVIRGKEDANSRIVFRLLAGTGSTFLL
jgi:hypothetical protein